MSLMNPRAHQITWLRRYRAAAERHLALVARATGVHATDTAALAHIIDRKRTKQRLYAGELAELLALSGPATTAVLDRLERAGLVVRRPSDTDGRRVEIEPAEGVELRYGKGPFGAVDQAIADVCSRHTEEEVASFTAILKEITLAYYAENERIAPTPSHLRSAWLTN